MQQSPDGADKAAAVRPPAVRMFGRYQLMRLLGKSERTMAWAVSEPRSGQDLVIALPRVQPAGTVAVEHWMQAVKRAARLSHPNLAPVVEVGVQDGWPYAAYDAADGAVLSDRLGRQGLPAAEITALAVQALQGLAFAHDGGVAHHDPQPYLLLVSDQGHLRVAGLEIAGDPEPDPAAAQAAAPAALHALRDAAQRDVLALGIVLHHGLVGQPALDEPDVCRVIGRLPPDGRDIVRLPWNTGRPVPDALRAIVNRATDRQERQRYRNARTLQRALEGWLQAEGDGAGGPLALLQDKLRVAGVLPSSPGAAAQAARMALMERERTSELAEIVLKDLALTFEMLRAVNTAQVRGGQVSGSGPVLTIRRAIAMLGLDGVRRAALSLRPWPGPLNEAGAAELERLIVRVKKAARIAVALRPAGWDAEVVYLVAVLQNLGRLVVQYHFPDEAAQIRRLMQPEPAARLGEPDDPGMTEEGASFAVLGIDIEAIGSAVARLWGLDETVLLMARRLPTATAVRQGHEDDDELRVVASCANETVDALSGPPQQLVTALQRVVQRYGRALNLTLKDLHAAALDGTSAVSGAPAAAHPPAVDPAAPATPKPRGLRAAAADRAAR